MSIPDVFDVTLPVLRTLGGGEKWFTQRLVTALASEFGLDEQDLARTRADGRPLFRNRIQWARTWLKKAGLIEYPETNWSAITPKGTQLLACAPQRLGRDFFELAWSEEDPPEVARFTGGTVDLVLEDELRRLTGPAVAADRDWEAIRLINGWGPDAPLTYKRVSGLLRRDERELLELGKNCRLHWPIDAPLLDAALAVVLNHPEQEPDELSLELAILGITRGSVCMAGLCEAARRFGRHTEWQQLLGYLARNRRLTHRPRPFGSWFELDVFLVLVDLGEHVVPQRTIGRYRVDFLLPDFAPQVVVECDGDAFHGDDRASRDRARERALSERGYTIVRFKLSDYRGKPDAVRAGLVEILDSLRDGGLQLRFAERSAHIYSCPPVPDTAKASPAAPTVRSDKYAS